MVPSTYEEACSIIVDQTRMIADLKRRLEWADERPGGGPRKIAGFTETETRVLRKIAARGFIAYGMFDALQRHMSNIRKKLPASVRIRTEIGEGYQVTDGLQTLASLVAGDITLVIETVTEAIASRPAKRAKPHPRAQARQAARKQRRTLPKPTVTIVPMGLTA